MASILNRLRGGRGQSRMDQNDWAAWMSNYFSFNGNQYPITYGQQYGQKQEDPPNDFESYANSALKSNAVIYACCQRRSLIFQEMRFCYRQSKNGKRTDTFGSKELKVLENPWPNGTTQELLARALQDVDMAGNNYVVREGYGPTARLRRLRPDWVTILLSEDPTKAVKSDVLGYAYRPGNTQDEDLWEIYPVDGSKGAIAHWSGLTPDPTAQYRGMSWITPIIREIMADKNASLHKEKFYEQGAPQPLDAKVLTPTGWSTMGDMAIGSRVIGADGRAHSVTDVFPQGEGDVYRVTFSDGTSAESTMNHLWRVSSAYDRQCGTDRVMTLAAIVDGGLRYPSGPHKWAVANVEAVEYDDNAGVLPLDPYALGVLLGDGSFRGGRVGLATHADDAEEWREAFAIALSDLRVDVKYRQREGLGGEFAFVRQAGTGRENQLTGIIRALGLGEVGSKGKFIPDAYMMAAPKDRLAVLQGLVDSDGHVEGTQIRFCSTSAVLATQLAELAMSLGANASLTECARKGQWIVQIRRMPDWATPCRLSRKVSAYRPMRRLQHARTIVSVDFTRRVETQCIRVDADDHMYITNDFIPTHNTPQLAISFKDTVSPENFEKFVKSLETHEGVQGAYKTIYLAGGADVTPVGAHLSQLNFAETQGHGETRIAAAAGIHPVLVGLSEAIKGTPLAIGNYQAAKDGFGEMFLRPAWASLCAAYQALVPKVNGAELWYDDSDISFLRQDRQAQADLQLSQAQSANTLIMAGYTAESVSKFFLADGDWSVLEHSGLMSVQMQEPGSDPAGGAGGNGPPTEKSVRPVPKEAPMPTDPYGKKQQGGAAGAQSE